MFLHSQPNSTNNHASHVRFNVQLTKCKNNKILFEQKPQASIPTLVNIAHEKLNIYVDSHIQARNLHKCKFCTMQIHQWNIHNFTKKSTKHVGETNSNNWSIEELNLNLIKRYLFSHVISMFLHPQPNPTILSTRLELQVVKFPSKNPMPHSSLHWLHLSINWHIFLHGVL